MNQSLADLITDTNELRSLPATTLRLLGLLDDPTAGADQVLGIIQTDPALTANLLRLCNSAYFGVPRQIGSTRQALVLLGNQTVLNLAFATSMGDILRGPLGGYHLDRNTLWHHTLGTAMAAAHLASRGHETAAPERAFTGGLVHDIGKLLLNDPLKRELVQLPRNASSAELMAAEISILGFDHAEAGAALASAWSFPPSLVQLIATHHLPEPESVLWSPLEPEVRGIARAVGAANLVAGHCGFGGGTRSLTAEELAAALAPLGYGPAVVAELVGRLPQDLDAMLGVIGESR